MRLPGVGGGGGGGVYKMTQEWKTYNAGQIRAGGGGGGRGGSPCVRPNTSGRPLRFTPYERC